MLALAFPRSTWLRKLSLTPARSAIVRSVARRRPRIARRRSPTSTSATASGALDGIQCSLDPVEGKLKRPYGDAKAVSIVPDPTRRKGPAGGAVRSGGWSPAQAAVARTPRVARYALAVARRAQFQ